MRRTRLAILAAPVAALTLACAPPPAVDALVQIDPCTEQPTSVDDPTRCVIWIDHQPAWGYPADTKFRGPYWEFVYDAGHNDGELLP